MNQAHPLPPVQPQPGQPLTGQSKTRQAIQSLLGQVTNWFNGLSGGGRVAAIAAAAIVGFVVVKTVFQLVASAISLAVLGVIVYLVYKLFVARSGNS